MTFESTEDPDRRCTFDHSSPPKLLNIETERYPICGQTNNPGACETCQHYFGMYSDGEIIWSARFDGFSDAWSSLAAACSEFHETHSRRPPRPVQRKFRYALRGLLGLDPVDDSASRALLDLLNLEFGPLVETDGMLSSSGRSLYLAKGTDLDQLIAQVDAVRLEIASLCNK